jgi:3-methyladenine DNA glycosylase AlkD
MSYSKATYYIGSMKKVLTAKEWFENIEVLFSQHADSRKAPAMEAYMKNNFRFLGIPKPERAVLSKTLYDFYGKPSKEILYELVPLLWEQPYREYHYLGMECLYFQRKHFQASDLSLFESLMRKQAWWDSIDFISPKLVASLCQTFPELLATTIERWSDDDDFWIRRAALLIQLKYKEHTQTERLFTCIRKLAHEKEFFIRKAIGWTLRELAKTDADLVRDFVENNSLSALSRKEALKHIG